MILKHYLKHLSLSILFYSILSLIFIICKPTLLHLNNNSLLHFDAHLYESIRNSGYYDTWLCAFFPLFPYLWKLLCLSAIGISIINAGIFTFSISALALIYKLDIRRQLFFISIPSIMFMFVPYTESLFFAAGTLLIIGFEKNKLGLLIVGLFLGSLIRPTTFVFIPAVLITFFLTTSTFKESLLKSILPTLALTIGLFFTVSIHYYFTHKWFVFFEAQKLWKNHLHMPQLPLTSWGGDGSVRFDGSALAIAIFCGSYLIFLFSKKMKSKITESRSLIFSTLYIVGTTLLILAYRDGNLYSLNRFIYATPFIVVVLHYFFVDYIFKWKHFWFLLIFTELLWLLFNSYNHIHNLLLFSTVSLYFGFLLLSKHNNKIISNLSFLSLILINCFGFIKLFLRFLNDVWVG